MTPRLSFPPRRRTRRCRRRARCSYKAARCPAPSAQARVRDARAERVRSPARSEPGLPGSSPLGPSVEPPEAVHVRKREVRKFHPTSGPLDWLTMPGGKFCWMMNCAVREVKALSSLLRYARRACLADRSSHDAERSFHSMSRIAHACRVRPATSQTPRTNPSLSTTATTDCSGQGSRRLADGLRDASVCTSHERQAAADHRPAPGWPTNMGMKTSANNAIALKVTVEATPFHRQW